MLEVCDREAEEDALLVAKPTTTTKRALISSTPQRDTIYKRHALTVEHASIVEAQS